MDYPPPRQSRNYHQYSNNSRGYSRSRSIDNRAKQLNHHQQEQLLYDDSTPTGFNTEDMYDDQRKDEGGNAGNKTLEDRTSASAPIVRGDYSGNISQEVSGDGYSDQNEGNTLNGNLLLGSSKVRATIVVSNICTKKNQEDASSILNSEVAIANDKQQSGYLGLTMSQNGTSRGSADKDNTSPVTSKETSAAPKDVDPNELRQKVLESLAEKKKKAAVFMNQEKEGTGKLETFPETKAVSATTSDDHASGIDNSQRKGSASNPERDAAVNALLAEAMGSVKQASSRLEASPTEVSKVGMKSPDEESFDPSRRKKHCPDDLKLSGKSTTNELHKAVSPRTGPDHDLDSSRRSSFPGHYYPSPRNEKQFRGRNTSREDGYKDGHGNFNRTPTSATRPDFSRGQRGGYEHDERDRRDTPRQDVRHRYEDPPPSAKELRHPADKISPSEREGRRGDGDHRGHYPEEEEKIRSRRDDVLYKVSEAPRDESYSGSLRHPRQTWHGQDAGIEASSYPAGPPGRYLPPRDDPRMTRPPETDYAALYYRDLPEWLEITGYHDFPYRQMHLQRHRESRVLEERRMVIEDDPEVSRGYMTRQQTIAPREEDVRRARASSAYAMPPPGIPSRDERELPSRVHEVPHRASSRAAIYPPVSRLDERSRYAEEFRVASPTGDAGGLKRRLPFREDDYEDLSRPTGKSARLAYESSHRGPQSDEYVNSETFGAYNKAFPSTRSGHAEPADNRHPSRRAKEERFEDAEDEASAVRQSLSKRIAASRGREISPPPLLESRIRKPSPSRRGYDNDPRKEGFIKRDHEDPPGPPSKFQREEGRPQRKPFDKEYRTPEQPPRFQKDFQKPGRTVPGKFIAKDDFRKPFQHLRRPSDEFHSPGGNGNMGRRSSFGDDFKKKPGFSRGRGRGGFHKEFHPSTRHENRESYADPMDVDRRPEITIGEFS